MQLLKLRVKWITVLAKSLSHALFYVRCSGQASYFSDLIPKIILLCDNVSQVYASFSPQLRLNISETSEICLASKWKTWWQSLPSLCWLPKLPQGPQVAPTPVRCTTKYNIQSKLKPDGEQYHCYIGFLLLLSLLAPASIICTQC